MVALTKTVKTLFEAPCCSFCTLLLFSITYREVNPRLFNQVSSRPSSLVTETIRVTTSVRKAAGLVTEVSATFNFVCPKVVLRYLWAPLEHYPYRLLLGELATTSTPKCFNSSLNSAIAKAAACCSLDAFFAENQMSTRQYQNAYFPRSTCFTYHGLFHQLVLGFDSVFFWNVIYTSK